MMFKLMRPKSGRLRRWGVLNLGLQTATFGVLFCLSVGLTSCFEDSGVAEPVEPQPDADTSPDVPLSEPDLGPQFTKRYCNGTGDYNTTPYIDSVMSQQCVGNLYRSIVRLYECKGCRTPTVCSDCDRPPSHYYLFNFDRYDIDQTGIVLDQENGFISRCQIEGACTAVEDFDITVETHSPGSCISGSYRITNGTSDITGTFDAAAIDFVDESKAEACRDN